MKRILFAVLAFLLFTDIINAQSTCPSGGGFISESRFGLGMIEPLPFNIWGGVNFQWRNVGGNIDIKVDWSTFDWNGKAGITTEEAKGLAMLQIIKNLLELEIHCSPDPGQVQFSFYESVTCKKELHAYLRVKQSANLGCKDDPNLSPNVPIYNFNGVHTVRISKLVDCGTACCKTTFTVECKYDPTNGYTVPNIIAVNKSILPGTECSGEGLDCKGQPTFCGAECN